MLLGTAQNKAAFFSHHSRHHLGIVIFFVIPVHKVCEPSRMGQHVGNVNAVVGAVFFFEPNVVVCIIALSFEKEKSVYFVEEIFWIRTITF